MTVPTETSSSSYTGNGMTMTFAIGFAFAHPAEVVVLIGAVVQAQGSAYSVSGSNVVFSLPPAAGASITIQRLVTYTQPTNFRTQGAFSPEVHESQMDAIVYQTQQLSRMLAAATSRINALEAAGGGGGGVTMEEVEAAITAAIMSHANFGHFNFDNGLTVLSNPDGVFNVHSGNTSIMALFNNTAGPLSLTADPPLQTSGTGGDNEATVVLVNASAQAITFNSSSFLILNGGSCTLFQNESLTLAYLGPYIGSGELWVEVARSRPPVLPP